MADPSSDAREVRDFAYVLTYGDRDRETDTVVVGEAALRRAMTRLNNEQKEADEAARADAKTYGRLLPPSSCYEWKTDFDLELAIQVLLTGPLHAEVSWLQRVGYTEVAVIKVPLEQ